MAAKDVVQKLEANLDNGVELDSLEIISILGFINTLKLDTAKLPDFLYNDNGNIKIAMNGDEPIKDYWDDFVWAAEER